MQEEEEQLTQETNKLSAAQLDMFVKESITTCLQLYPTFKQTDTLVITLYNVMKSMFVDGKNHVILSAPTGTGKSVIGYMINFCFIYMTDRLNKSSVSYEEFKNSFSITNTSVSTYTLTSSKILQEQIDGDIIRFNMTENLAILKGVRNYECTYQTKETGTYHNYSERFCSGMSSEDRNKLACSVTCPYLVQRSIVSNINNGILNYAYFLSVLKSGFNPFFGVRDLTICDEAHLIPDIVSGSFNIDLSMMSTNKMIELYKSLTINFPSLLESKITVTDKKETEEGEDNSTVIEEVKPSEQFKIGDTLKATISELFKFFTSPLPDDTKSLELFAEKYWKNYKIVSGIFERLLSVNKENSTFLSMYQKDFNRIVDYVEFNDFSDFINSLKNRPEDLFVESTEITVNALPGVEGIYQTGRYKIFKHNIYDLSEAEMCRKHFLGKVNKAVYMSATLGNIDEFAILMGLKPEEYAGFRLQSNFNFDTSPIYLTNSGYLNYAQFENNIGAVINDTVKICTKLHPNEKGIIHTSTFNIANLLKNETDKLPDFERYLYYTSSEEKEQKIELMKNSDKPYIIIGPSLFEGIDLKDDLGRLNITIKAPYSGMSNYIRKKMERYPFWYKRVVLEKLEQAIGRTNRHIDDRSINYLLDSVLNKLVFELPEHITKRVSFFTVK